MEDFATLAISNHGLRHGGGIERYALTLVRGLHARGIRPTVLAKSFDTSLPEYGWVRPVRLGTGAVPGKLRDFWFDWRIGRAKRRLGLAPLIACNQTRWSDIGICGSTHPGFLAASGRRAGMVDRWKIALERAHLKGSAVVVAHSERMHDEAVRFYGVDPTRIVLLYPPVDRERFGVADKHERERLRSALDLPTDRTVFLLASTGHRRKGLDRLASFFAETRLPVLLAVAGRPIERALPNVQYLGYRADIEYVYRAVDFTLMASTYEPFGLVGVESVLCGTSVLLADNVGCAEVIREPAKIGFDLDAPDGLANAIEEAVARRAGGRHRVADPSAALAYDPGVAAHVDALLRLAAGLAPHA